MCLDVEPRDHIDLLGYEGPIHFLNSPILFRYCRDPEYHLSSQC